MLPVQKAFSDQVSYYILLDMEGSSSLPSFVPDPSSQAYFPQEEGGIWSRESAEAIYRY